jgi:putative MATE family efflux protein
MNAKLLLGGTILKDNLLTNGSIFKALFIFSLPIIVTNTINVLFHAADVAVLAFFAGDVDVAAVGACGPLITLMVSLFTGLSAGASVLISKRVGSNDEQGVKRAVGTSLSVGFLSGIFLMLLSLVFARRFLILMNCQPDVLDAATLYMQIYFLGSPIMMLNNFAVAGVSASGDSTRPMIYSMLSGVINVLLNIVFVAFCGLSVAGVAIATVFSASVSLVLVIFQIFKGNGRCKAEFSGLRIRKNEFWEIVKVGVPTCFASISFFLANVVLSSAVNSLGTDAMTANAVSGQFDGIIYTIGAAIAVATSVIVAQNYGAYQFKRMKKAVLVGSVYATAVSLLLGIIFVVFADPMLSIMSDSENVVSIAKDRMTFLCLTYFITSIMEVLAFSLRAIKLQLYTMSVGVVCGLGIRCFWRYFIWPANPTLSMLFACYAVSAFVAIVIYLFVFGFATKTLHREERSVFA